MWPIITKLRRWFQRKKAQRIDKSPKIQQNSSSWFYLFLFIYMHISLNFIRDFLYLGRNFKQSNFEKNRSVSLYKYFLWVIDCELIHLIVWANNQFIFVYHSTRRIPVILYINWRIFCLKYNLPLKLNE